MGAASPPRAPLLSPRATQLCSAIVLVLHVGYCCSYCYFAQRYFQQTLVDETIVNFVYRLLGMGSTAHRGMSLTMGVTSVCIAFYHAVGVFRATRASLRLRRLLLDVPDEQLIAKLKDKLKSFKSKRGKQLVDAQPAPVAQPKSCFGRFMAKLLDIRRDYLIMDGKHFETGTNVRETLEIVTQINLIHRMSRTVDTQRINDLVVAIFVLNCWSTPLLRFAFRDGDPLVGRVVRHLASMVLASCFTVAIPISILSYVEPMFKDQNNIFSQHATTRLRLLAQHVIVTQWLPVVSTRMAACMAFVAFEALKRKLALTESERAAAPSAAEPTSRDGSQYKVTTASAKVEAAAPQLAPLTLQTPATEPPVVKREAAETAPEARGACQRLRGAARQIHASGHIFFDVVWFCLGVLVIALHVQANSLPEPVPGVVCHMPIHQWLAPKVSCAILEVNCYRAGVAGTASDIDGLLGTADASVLSALRLTHCPALEMPRRIASLHNIAVLEVYNSTIVRWGLDAALTHVRHPFLGSVWLIRVAGVASLPVGLLSTDFPAADFQVCYSDLAGLPDDLPDRWPRSMSRLLLEHSHLTEYPPALLRMWAVAFSLAGNNLTTIPDAAFAGRRFGFISVSGNRHLGRLPETGVVDLVVAMQQTNVSSLPAWMTSPPVTSSAVVLGGDSPVCAGYDEATTLLLPSGMALSCTKQQDPARGLGIFPINLITLDRLP